MRSFFQLDYLYLNQFYDDIQGHKWLPESGEQVVMRWVLFCHSSVTPLILYIWVIAYLIAATVNPLQIFKNTIFSDYFKQSISKHICTTFEILINVSYELK